MTLKIRKVQAIDQKRLKIGRLQVSHCKIQKKGSYKTDGQFKLMVINENHNYQVAPGSCHIQDKKIDIASRISELEFKNSG